MQCTNQDQYRTIYTHSVCVCVLAFDILIYLYRAHNGFVGWSVVRLARSVLYLHPNAPRLPVSAFPNVRFPLWPPKEKKFTQTERKTSTKWSSHKNGQKNTHTRQQRQRRRANEQNCTLQNAMLRAIKHYYTGRTEQSRQMARPIWMNLYVLCTQ